MLKLKFALSVCDIPWHSQVNLGPDLASALASVDVGLSRSNTWHVQYPFTYFRKSLNSFHDQYWKFSAFTYSGKSVRLFNIKSLSPLTVTQALYSTLTDASCRKVKIPGILSRGKIWGHIAAVKNASCIFLWGNEFTLCNKQWLLWKKGYHL